MLSMHMYLVQPFSLFVTVIIWLSKVKGAGNGNIIECLRAPLSASHLALSGEQSYPNAFKTKWIKVGNILRRFFSCSLEELFLPPKK